MLVTISSSAEEEQRQLQVAVESESGDVKGSEYTAQVGYHPLSISWHLVPPVCGGRDHARNKKASTSSSAARPDLFQDSCIIFISQLWSRESLWMAFARDSSFNISTAAAATWFATLWMCRAASSYQLAVWVRYKSGIVPWSIRSSSFIPSNERKIFRISSRNLIVGAISVGCSTTCGRLRLGAAWGGLVPSRIEETSGGSPKKQYVFLSCRD